MKALERTCNIDDLRRLAKQRLPRGVYEFVARGTEDEVGLGHNRTVLDSIKIKPRVLTDVSRRDTSTTLLGRGQKLPLIVGPTGAAGLLWYQGEAQLARAAAAAGVPYVLAMSSITPLEDVRAACDGQLWFQLYLSPEQEISDGMIDRARAARFDALVLTVDTVVSPNREYNSRNGFSVPVTVNRRNIFDFALHPRWTLGVIGRYLANGGMPRFENYPQGMRNSVAGRQKQRWAPVKRDESADWRAVAQVRKRWSGPLIVKGIGCVEDALAAAQAGADAIIVSNHGGRNVDSAVSPTQLLPRVVAAVAGRCPVWVDSGFVRGSDVFKALALGAEAVLLGRATLYGLAAGGEAGGLRSLTFFKEELDRCMAFAGTPDLAAINAHCLQDFGLVYR
ncbi:MAG: alpha-hydroxy acid oxidase [Janthinobacterium lividum]|uniref:alpha-hydroxy acid oxidase n=1 Tax=Pseudomonas sp. MWU16-30317 TaxID=2878095 RepID=UPI001CFBD5AD|nr:alpha-hydroxy acid oxidase [Pseudomonas sp. MWU16-30317]